MEANYLDNLVGVFGSPVAENPTVVMMEAGFRELGLNWKYLTIEVKKEDLEDAIRGLKAFNMRGINLTIPHKIEVLKYLDEVADDARLMGAVNTVRREGSKLIGENTDGKGFLRSLREDGGTTPAEKNIVLLGAGGAARAIGVELALAGAQHLRIVNRTPARGNELAELINGKTDASAEYIAWDVPFVLPGDTDILVNATSIGLFPDIKAKPGIDYSSIRPGMIVCDVIPNPPRTVFLKEAENRGAKTLDGLGMLVYQGTIGFKMWTGVDAPVSEMKAALKQAFGL